MNKAALGRLAKEVRKDFGFTSDQPFDPFRWSDENGIPFISPRDFTADEDAMRRFLEEKQHVWSAALLRDGGRSFVIYNPVGVPSAFAPISPTKWRTLKRSMTLLQPGPARTAAAVERRRVRRRKPPSSPARSWSRMSKLSSRHPRVGVTRRCKPVPGECGDGRLANEDVGRLHHS
jgi:hypothetical protein